MEKYPSMTSDGYHGGMARWRDAFYGVSQRVPILCYKTHILRSFWNAYFKVVLERIFYGRFRTHILWSIRNANKTSLVDNRCVHVAHTHTHANTHTHTRTHTHTLKHTPALFQQTRQYLARAACIHNRIIRTMHNARRQLG